MDTSEIGGPISEEIRAASGGMVKGGGGHTGRFGFDTCKSVKLDL
jgi:hypothetical protein